MKKFRLISLLIAVVMVVSMLFVFAACGNTGDNGIEDIIKEGEGMTTEQLLAKAKEETGNFVTYGNTSRISTALNGFLAKYGTDLGLTSSNASASQQSDSAIYQLLTTEYSSVNNSSAASMVMIQDGAQLVTYRENSKILQNYVPSTMKDKVDSNDLVPLVHQYINKLFSWNKTGSGADLKITNVWQIVDPAVMNGRTLYFKNPATEQVNMNFLVMLTNDYWSAKIAAAYKEYKGTDIVLDSDCPNAGYQWIKEFIKKADYTITSDTTICNTLNNDANAGNMGLFVLSKMRALNGVDSTTGQPLVNNMQVGAWQQENNEFVEIEPFAGFMYPMYCQLATNGPRPYTAMLFINYLMTEDGFSPWADWGAYSTNPDVGIQDGDQELSFWRNCLVIEDASYILSNKATISEWVDGLKK